jgi:hypothetical protein
MLIDRRLRMTRSRFCFAPGRAACAFYKQNTPTISSASVFRYLAEKRQEKI